MVGVDDVVEAENIPLLIVYDVGHILHNLLHFPLRLPVLHGVGPLVFVVDFYIGAFLELALLQDIEAVHGISFFHQRIIRRQQLRLQQICHFLDFFRDKVLLEKLHVRNKLQIGRFLRCDDLLQQARSLSKSRLDAKGPRTYTLPKNYKKNDITKVLPLTCRLIVDEVAAAEGQMNT